MKKKVTRAKQIKIIKKELTKLCHDKVLKRDGHKCLMCGLPEDRINKVFLHAHHWYKRKGRSQALAYDIRNLATLCYSCHIGNIHRNGDGEFMIKFLQIMSDKIGQANISDMDEIARHPHTLTLEDYQDIKSKLEGML